MKVDENTAWLGRIWIWLNVRGKDKENKYSYLHESSYSGYRKCVTALAILLVYFIAFFLW